jgi:hypothetical protein
LRVGELLELLLSRRDGLERPTRTVGLANLRLRVLKNLDHLGIDRRRTRLRLHFLARRLHRRHRARLADPVGLSLGEDAVHRVRKDRKPEGDDGEGRDHADFPAINLNRKRGSRTEAGRVPECILA